MEKEKLIQRGAEAELFECEYFGRKAVAKRRVPKTYRNSQIDEKIRRLRTKEECLLLQKAKQLGVRTPIMYRVDRKNCEILMEFIEGEKLRDKLNKKNFQEYCRRTGENIGRMHKANLIHGDLTTSNILIHNDFLVFVDFGLGLNSAKVEDKAVDLLAFKKTFMATHFDIADGWKMVLEGYESAYSEGKAAARQIPVIEGRARYS